MIREFLPSDLPEINRWFAARGAAELELRHLPETGFISPGVAAGFLYLTDSSIALLESYVSSPSAGLKDRSRAIDAITAALLAEAKRREVSNVVAICATRGIERRAQKFGMQVIGTYAMASRRI